MAQARQIGGCEDVTFDQVCVIQVGETPTVDTALVQRYIETWSAALSEEQTLSLIKAVPTLMLTDQTVMLFANSGNAQALNALKFSGWKPSSQFKQSLMRTLRDSFLDLEDSELQEQFEHMKTIVKMDLL